MTLPVWLAAALAVAMLLVAAGCMVRLAIWRLRGRAAEPEADALHVVMGVAMAGMFEPQIRLVPDTAWMAVFGAATAWFAVRAIRTRIRSRQASDSRLHEGSWRCAHPAPHCVESAAMIYMLIPVGAGHAPAVAMAAMASGAPTANPAIALVLALFLLGYVVWTADRLTRQPWLHTAAAVGPPQAYRAEPGGAYGAEAGGAPGRAVGAALAPRAAECSKIAMSLAMGYMLLTML
jgi:Domain of unknown function (DUF5134)